MPYDYFVRLHEKYDTIFPTPSVQKIEDAGFYAIMKEAFSDENPFIYYQNSQLTTKLVFSVIKMLPGRLGDRARVALMKLPQY